MPDARPALQAYYAQRAPEYERVYAKPERQADLRRLEAWVADACAERHGWELACGTGWWTAHAAARCRSWLATDVNDEVLAIARAKAWPDDRVRFAFADALADALMPPAHCDLVFAAFWWSHLPRESLTAWLARLHRGLAPGTALVFIDNRFVEASSTPIARRDAQGNTFQQRTLADGSRHEVLKNFPTRAEALGGIGPRARAAEWHELAHYWALRYAV